MARLYLLNLIEMVVFHCKLLYYRRVKTVFSYVLYTPITVLPM